MFYSYHEKDNRTGTADDGRLVPKQERVKSPETSSEIRFFVIQLLNVFIMHWRRRTGTLQPSPMVTHLLWVLPFPILGWTCSHTGRIARKYVWCSGSFSFLDPQWHKPSGNRAHSALPLLKNTARQSLLGKNVKVGPLGNRWTEIHGDISIFLCRHALKSLPGVNG